MTNADIINGLSVCILQAANAAAAEQHDPGSNPDRMDEIIKANLTRLKELRRIREEFENIVTGVIL